MAYEEDYILRLIKDMVRALASVILGEKYIEYELPEGNQYTDMDRLYKKLTDMAEEGKINEAENILLTEMIPENKEYLRVAIGFYQHINQYKDEFLEMNGYSRQEILEGIEDLAADNGIQGLGELVKTDL